jgi:hypothetical protein
MVVTGRLHLQQAILQPLCLRNAEYTSCVYRMINVIKMKPVELHHISQCDRQYKTRKDVFSYSSRISNIFFITSIKLDNQGNRDIRQTFKFDHILIHIQGVSRLEDITAGGDFLGLCDQKSSHKQVSDFGRLRSYDRLKLRGEGNDY